MQATSSNIDQRIKDAWVLEKFYKRSVAKIH